MDTVSLMQKIRGALTGYDLTEQPGGRRLIVKDASGARVQIFLEPLPNADPLAGVGLWERETMERLGITTPPPDAEVARVARGEAPYQLEQAKKAAEAEAAAKAETDRAATAKALSELAALKKTATK